MTGRFGLGAGVEEVVKAFNIKLNATSPDLFAAVCIRGADTMIADATEPRIADRLPAWYHESVDAPTFLLLPLTVKGKPFGLIYADKTPATIDNLAAVLKPMLSAADPGVVVAADSKAPEGIVVQAMLAARHAGVEHFLIAVKMR